MYQWAGARWKRYPSIPLWLGILLLLTTFVLHWWLEGVAEVDNNIVKDPGSKLTAVAKQTIAALGTAYSRQAKFVELAVIPLAMALIGTALVLKIENDFTKQVRKVEGMRRRLERLDARIRTAERAMLVAVLMKTRGEALLKAKQDVDFLYGLRFDLQLDTRELERKLGLRDKYGFDW